MLLTSRRSRGKDQSDGATPVTAQREELQRVLDSPQFRRAPKLRKFLGLVCEYYFEGKSPEITEFLIATEAFGKSPDFDASQDSIVRVQAREARRRLREYYQGPGKTNHVILDIPVGSYVPVFTAVSDGQPSRWRNALRPSWPILATAALVLVAVLLSINLARLRTRAASGGPEPLGPALTALWDRFLHSTAPTILVLSNPTVDNCNPPNSAEAAEGSATSGLHPCPDEFTGMGEAVALHLITEVFKNAKQTLLVKQSRLLTPEEAQRSNLILLGGRAVNSWAERLGPDIVLPESLPGIPSSRFETAFDRAGALTNDRGMFALRKDAQTGRWRMFLYGGHSQGTHAIAEAATNEGFLSQLKFPGLASGFPDQFHVMASVTVRGPARYDIVPVSVHTP